MTFDTDYMEFAAPNPQPMLKFLAVIKPFDVYVWMGMGASLIVISMAMWIFAKQEGKLLNQHFRTWEVKDQALWYAFGTFIGESITRDTNSQAARGLRLVSKSVFY